MHDDGDRGLTVPLWAVRVIPTALLVALAVVGLRGAIATPRWNGPLHRYGIAVGLLLVAVLGTLLAITWIRHRAARAIAGPDAVLDVPAKLRIVLMAVLSTGIVATLVVILVALHLHLFNVKPQQQKAPPTLRPSFRSPPPENHASSTVNLPLANIFYALLVLALIGVILLCIRWARQLRPPVRMHPDLDEDDSENLREAVESGRSALRTLDDARAAIIACYVAMEQSLAERGAARGVADTPDELLARATRSRIVHGTAAARLTALFYEARFSSHPMDQAQRQAAEQALDELAAALATSEAPEKEEAGA